MIREDKHTNALRLKSISDYLNNIINKKEGRKKDAKSIIIIFYHYSIYLLTCR